MMKFDDDDYKVYKNKIDKDGFYQSGSIDVFDAQLTDEYYLFLNNIDNDQPLQIDKSHIDDFLWFYQKGADIAILSYNGNDFLHLLAGDLYAPMADFYKVTNAFRSVGANLENIASSGDTPLTKAVMMGNKRMVRELVQSGADVKAKNSHFRPLEMALHNGDIDIAYLLTDDLRMTLDQKEALIYNSDFFNNISLQPYVKQKIFSFIKNIYVEMSETYTTAPDVLLKEYLEKIVPMIKNKTRLTNISFTDKLTMLRENIALVEKNGFSKNPQGSRGGYNVLDKLLHNIDLRMLDFFVAEGIDLKGGFTSESQAFGRDYNMNALQKAIMLSDVATVSHIVKNNIQGLNESSGLWSSFNYFNNQTIEIYELLKNIDSKGINDIKSESGFIDKIIIQGNRDFIEYTDFISKVLKDDKLPTIKGEDKLDFSWENKHKTENVLSLFLKNRKADTFSNKEKGVYCKVFKQLLNTNAIKNNVSFDCLCLKPSSLNIKLLEEIKRHYGHFDIKKSTELEVIMVNLILKSRVIDKDELQFVLDNVIGLTNPMKVHLIAEIFKSENKTFDDMMKDDVLDLFIQKQGLDFSSKEENKETNQLLVSLLGYNSYLKCLAVKYNLDVSESVNTDNLGKWQQKELQDFLLEVEKIHLSNDANASVLKKKNNFKV